MNVFVRSIATATPHHSITQRQAFALATAIDGVRPDRSRSIERLFAGTRIDSRGVILADADGNGIPSFYPASRGAGDRGPTTRDRMARFEIEAPRLAAAACRDALREADVAADRITHLVCVCCTGFAAPGVDLDLLGSLGLRPTVTRVNVGFMGCHGAINGLGVVSSIIRADPQAVVLMVAVELCSLHFRYGWDPGAFVANALFADGTAAMVAAASAADGNRPAPWRILATGSTVIDGTGDAMTWRIGDHGFEMTLGPEVPGIIRRRLAAWLVPWLDSRGLSVDDVGSWAVHPGGPKIVEAAASALGLDASDAAPSLAVLAEHGNMSSPTALFIVRRLLDERCPAPCVALAFGPGLAVEAALLG